MMRSAIVLIEPQRGDIVVFRYPRDPQEYFIKRVIGLPGEKIEIKDGSGLYLQSRQSGPGLTLEETICRGRLKLTAFMNGETLGASEYYVLGDNRNSSKDSRVSDRLIRFNYRPGFFARLAV